MISRTIAIIIVAKTYIICPEYCLTETYHFYVFYISHKFYELESVISFNFTGKGTEAEIHITKKISMSMIPAQPEPQFCVLLHYVLSPKGL